MKLSVRIMPVHCVLVASALWSSDAGAANRGPDFDNDDKDDNLDNDNFEELIIGVPNDSSVTVIRGSSTGLVNTNDLMWTQATTNVPGDEDLSDSFGYCLTYGQRWHPDTDSGVAMCNPDKAVDEVYRAGMLHALYINNEFIEASSVGIVQSDIDASLVEADDYFRRRRRLRATGPSPATERARSRR